MADTGGVPYASQDLLDVDGKTVKVLLLAGVVVDRGIVNANEVTAFEVAYSAYVRKTLTSVTYDETTGVADADFPTWTTLGTGDIDAAVFIDATSGVDATSPVLAFANFDPPRDAAGDDFVLSWGANGWARHDDANPDLPEAWTVGGGINSWSDPVYRRDRGMVEFKGEITGGDADDVILTDVGANYRPAVDLIAYLVKCHDGDPTNYGLGHVTITAAGEMSAWYPPGFPNVSLVGVRYPVT